LTSGYRTTYWVLFILMVVGIVGTISQGGVAIPGGAGIAVAYALYRDWSIRKRIELASRVRQTPGPTAASPSPAKPTPSSSDAVSLAAHGSIGAPRKIEAPLSSTAGIVQPRTETPQEQF